MPQERPNHYGKFTHIRDDLEDRIRLRETIAARTLGLLGLAGLIVAFWSTFGWIMFGFGTVGFLVTCYIAGNRQYVRSGKPRGRPF